MPIEVKQTKDIALHLFFHEQLWGVTRGARRGPDQLGARFDPRCNPTTPVRALSGLHNAPSAPGQELKRLVQAVQTERNVVRRWQVVRTEYLVNQQFIERHLQRNG